MPLPLARSAAAPGFFSVARLAGAMFKFLLYLLPGNIPRAQQDNKVIDNVGALLDQRRPVALGRGDHRLDRLFAELFGGAGRAGLEQRLRVGMLGRGSGTRRDNRREIVKAEAAHLSASQIVRTCSPARHICSFASAIVYVPK